MAKSIRPPIKYQIFYTICHLVILFFFISLSIWAFSTVYSYYSQLEGMHIIVYLALATFCLIYMGILFFQFGERAKIPFHNRILPFLAILPLWLGVLFGILTILINTIFISYTIAELISYFICRYLDTRNKI